MTEANLEFHSEAVSSDQPSPVWELIDSIYETGQSPDEWPLLIDGLVQHLDARERGAVEEVDLAFHFENALRFNRHLDAVTQDPAFLKSVRFPMLVVGESLEIAYVSSHNPPYLHDQAPFRIDGGSLHVQDSGVEQALAALFAGPATQATPRCLFESRGIDRVYALPLQIDSRVRYVALLFTPDETEVPLSEQDLCTLYDLTAAEATLARELVRRPDTKDLARSLSIAEGSVRTQLKRIYQKTGTCRKAELVAKILCGPALLAKLTPPARRLFDDDREERRNQLLELPRGGVLGYAEYGPADGAPVLHIHNLIGSRLQLPTRERNLRDQGVRLIVPDRPGVGLSSALDPFSFETWSEDMVALADALGIERFAVVGSSLGAVYSLALARYQPERVSRVALVSCVPEVDSLSVLRGLPAQTASIFALARTAPGLLGFVLRMITRKGAQAYLDQLICELPAADQRLYEDPGFHEMMVSAIVEALRQGSSGFLHDIRTMALPWSFRPEDVEVPVQCWHGEADTPAPLELVRPLFEALPHGELEALPGESHWMIFRHWNTILATLLAEDRADARA
jgi:pimeloyl-ACP methyl ester carboxylesterase/DNA-binding CsgD family transcriptional regulator